MNFISENSRFCSLETVCSHEELTYTAYPLKLPANTRTFFRPARSSVFAYPKNIKKLPVGLDAILKRTEEEFAIIQEFGVSIVGHEWGLVKHPRSALESRRYAMARLIQMLTPGRSYIPKGYLLVAKVDYIDSFHPYKTDDGTITDALGINGLYHQTRKAGDICLSDVHDGQAMIGINRNIDTVTQELPQPWLHDIDPLLMIK